MMYYVTLYHIAGNVSKVFRHFIVYFAILFDISRQIFIHFSNSYCFPDVSFHNQNCSTGSIIDMQCNKTAVTVLPDNSGL